MRSLAAHIGVPHLPPALLEGTGHKRQFEFHQLPLDSRSVDESLISMGQNQRQGRNIQSIALSVSPFVSPNFLRKITPVYLSNSFSPPFVLPSSLNTILNKKGRFASIRPWIVSHEKKKENAHVLSPL